jgi:hypothetical protein
MHARGAPGVVGVSRHTIRVDDETLDAFLDNAENKSETVREALHLYRMQRGGVDDERLTDKQRAAYAWLRDYAGVGETAQYEVVETVLAQKLSMSAGIIEELVMKPLERLGYVAVSPRMSHVVLRVRPPDAVDVPETSQPIDDAEDVSERLDTLASAAEGVSEGAD